MRFKPQLVSKIVLYLSVWFFVWAIFPLGWNRPFVEYLSISTLNWLAFIGCVIVSFKVESLKPKDQQIQDEYDWTREYE